MRWWARRIADADAARGDVVVASAVNVEVEVIVGIVVDYQRDCEHAFRPYELQAITSVRGAWRMGKAELQKQEVLRSRHASAQQAVG